jgi:hypothetical protein
MRAAQLRVLGGAMAGVPVDATASAHRQSKLMLNVAAVYERAERSRPSLSESTKVDPGSEPRQQDAGKLPGHADDRWPDEPLVAAERLG